MTARSRAIYGCAGTELSAREGAFFRETRPWGFILFARNARDPEQVRRLVQSLREATGEKAPVLIDQEGGRVTRLKPPHWKAWPPAQRFGDLYRTAPDAAREAAYLNARSIGHEISELGIDVDCCPVLDVPVEDADAVIGDRAFSRDPAVVSDLGRAAIRGMMDSGVLPVMKHAPGHGRANVDSHLSLPRVSVPVAELRATDFAPFRALRDCPIAMTAHAVYDAIDTEHPATTSAKVIREAIRGDIGFAGLLISDDLSMNALSGSLAKRTRAALAAGCDIALHCNGRIVEMKQVASEASPLEGEPLSRAERALSRRGSATAFDSVEADDRIAELLGAAA